MIFVVTVIRLMRSDLYGNNYELNEQWFCGDHYQLNAQWSVWWQLCTECAVVFVVVSNT